MRRSIPRALACCANALLLASAVLIAQGPSGRGGAAGPQVGAFVAYPQRPISDLAAVERGRGMYAVNCAFCHGSDARGGDSGPNLMRSQMVLNDQAGEQIGIVVVNGRPPGMPKFTLRTEQVSDLAAFLHSLPVSSRTGASEINIVVGDAKAGEAVFKSKCASCHTPSGDLSGVATKYADPKALQQTWLLPGSGGTRNGGPPRLAPPVAATVTLPSGERTTGTLDRIDDFVVSLRLADGTLRTLRTTGTATKVDIADPLQAHRALLGSYSDSEIHNVTAYLVTLK